MQRRSNALARGLAELGVGEGDSVAIMCRNHRGFVTALIAADRLGRRRRREIRRSRVEGTRLAAAALAGSR